MSDTYTDFITNPSPYLSWLWALSPEEHVQVEQQAEAIELSLRALVAITNLGEPAMPVGVWLHALCRVCRDLEHQLRDPSGHSREEA